MHVNIIAHHTMTIGIYSSMFSLIDKGDSCASNVPIYKQPREKTGTVDIMLLYGRMRILRKVMS